MHPLAEKNEMFFYTLMNIIFVGAVVMLTSKFYKDIHEEYLWLGKKLGLIWTTIQLGLDLVVFLLVFKMEPTEYFEKIGITYVTLPIITMGMGYVLQSHVEKHKANFNPKEPLGDAVKFEETQSA